MEVNGRELVELRIRSGGWDGDGSSLRCPVRCALRAAVATFDAARHRALLRAGLHSALAALTQRACAPSPSQTARRTSCVVRKSSVYENWLVRIGSPRHGS